MEENITVHGEVTFWIKIVIDDVVVTKIVYNVCN